MYICFFFVIEYDNFMHTLYSKLPFERNQHLFPWNYGEERYTGKKKSISNYTPSTRTNTLNEIDFDKWILRSFMSREFFSVFRFRSMNERGPFIVDAVVVVVVSKRLRFKLKFYGFKFKLGMG